MDFMKRIFAVITATPAKRDEEGRPHFTTYGHDNAYCAAIKRDRVISENDSIEGFLAENEWFDGEITYSDPWPCNVCIPVEKLQKEQPRPPMPSDMPERAPRTEQPALTDSGDVVADALAFARSIDPSRETFSFLREMAKKAQDDTWRPTERQAQAILNCRKGGKKKGARPEAVPAATTEPSDTDFAYPPTPSRPPATPAEPTLHDEAKPKLKNPDEPASDRQVTALTNLARVKTPDWFSKLGEEGVRARAAKLTKGQASQRISDLMRMPRGGAKAAG